MSVIILTANLGGFDTPVDPVEQTVAADFRRFTDENFPPITGLTPRLQYRIPKTHAWQMVPDYDYYIWLDGSASFQREDCVRWFLNQLGNGDIAFFKHPHRGTIKQEVEYIEEHLEQKKPYITSRYNGGLHREFLTAIQREGYPDHTLYASTAFIYRNTPRVQRALANWWGQGSRWFTCDQVQLPYILWRDKLDVRVLDEPLYEAEHLTLGNHLK